MSFIIGWFKRDPISLASGSIFHKIKEKAVRVCSCTYDCKESPI